MKVGELREEGGGGGGGVGLPTQLYTFKHARSQFLCTQRCRGAA